MRQTSIVTQRAGRPRTRYLGPWIRFAVVAFLLATAYCLLSTPSAGAQTMDRIQRGCGGLGGTLVRVLTDFDGSVRIMTCTGGFVYICNSAGVCTALPAPGSIITGSGTAGTLPLWSAATVLTNSILTQTGTTSVNLLSGSFIYGGIAAPSASIAGQGRFYFDSTSNTLKASYNAAAYFNVARSNVTVGTVALGGTGGLFGDAFITQAGANMTFSQTGGGNFAHLIGLTTYSNFNGASGAVRLGNQSVTGTATILLSPSNSRSDFGDTLTNQNGTIFRVDDSLQNYRFNKLVTCGYLATNASGDVGCGSGSPVTGSGTAGTLPIFLGGGTSLGNSYATQSGNNFTITQPAIGIITVGSAAARLILDDGGTTQLGDLTGGAPRIEASTGAGTVDLISGAVSDVRTNANGLTSAGDVNGNGNNTRLDISDTAETVTIQGSSSLVTTINSDTNIGLTAGAAQVQTLSGSGGVVKLGDITNAGNRTKVTVDDGGQQITFAAGVGGATTTFTVNVGSYVANKLPSCTFISTDSGGVLQCGTGTPGILSGASGSIGGGLLAAGGCTSGTATVTGVATTDAISVTPATYPGDGIYWNAYMSAANTVTVKVCAVLALTPTASVYSVRAIQ